MKMHKKGHVHETHGRKLKIKVYDMGGVNDRLTVCVDGGEPGLRWAFGAGLDAVWYYAGELFPDGDIMPAGDWGGYKGLGKLLDWADLSESLKKSIIDRLESGWAED